MKTRHVFAVLCLATLNVQAQTPACTEWVSRLRAELSAANACEAGYRDCMAKSANNPMRELGYCKSVLRQCQSLDGPVENEELRLQIEQYRKQCS
jgi:hypothetical protein